MSDELVQIAEVASRFVSSEVLPYLATPENELKYPAQIIQRMCENGFFAMGVPPAFDGLGLDRPTTIAVNIELGRGWLSLGALMGSHARVCSYVASRGTDQQQRDLLPKMAWGKLIAAHAFHEQANRDPTRFGTALSRVGGKVVLNGIKDWVTNARDAHFILVIARSELAETGNHPVAVIVWPDRDGVKIGPDLTRPGVKGVSLCPVHFVDYEVDLASDLVGGPHADIGSFLRDFTTGSSLNFSARALGASLALLTECRDFLAARPKGAPGTGVIRYKFAEATMLVQAAKAFLYSALSPTEDLSATTNASLTKVFSTRALHDTIRTTMMLKGGAGYASRADSLDRMYRDAASLELIDTPNDVLLSAVGDQLFAIRPTPGP